ncbi:hypothetical protein Pmani_006670 [Petrolisthes manimaculis]|nr:hypothetical protein Pmani_006670 [Petrolisthes manimaculis]
MREAVTCAVCSEVYQAGAREPLVLPCGHTFCRTCLASVKMTGNFLCPTCRQPHNNVQVDRLSVNYSLLSLSSACTDFEYETCGEHGDDLRYWCCGCELPLCSLCLYSGHPQGHNVQLAKAYVQEKKMALEAQIKLLDKKIDFQREEVKIKFVELVERVSELCQSSSTLHDTQLDVAHLLDQVRKVSSIESIMLAEESVSEFRTRMQALTSPFCDFSDVGSGDDCIDLDDTVPEDGGVREGTSQDEMPDTGAAAQEEQHSVVVEGPAGLRCARLDYLDGRLLLHCLARPTDTRLSLQLPSEVFLELSADGRCLGRVYIHLWNHLRRAQQFLALCLGTLGPTYLGARASKVINKNVEREMFIFEYHMESNKASSGRPIFTDLEWGSNYVKPVKEGILMTFEPGRGAATSMTTSFGICTREQPGGVCTCPFGEVVSGLEVVKAAVTHDPVTEVIITHCGLVLPDLTLTH